MLSSLLSLFFLLSVPITTKVVSSNPVHGEVYSIQHYLRKYVFVCLLVCLFVCLFDGVSRHFQQYFSYIVPVSFIGVGNKMIQIKSQTCRKSLTNFIT